jgi:hypothetical protein
MEAARDEARNATNCAAMTTMRGLGKPLLPGLRLSFLRWPVVP